MAIYGIKNRPLEPTSYYAGPPDLCKGDFVLVEHENIKNVYQLASGALVALPGAKETDLPAILRKANSEEIDAWGENQELAKKANRFCKERIQHRGLEMKLVDVEVFFDRSKFVFYFTAPTRIDFRDLVKDLVREYRARIELRQIGVRHETQMLGAIGNCGQVCCCRRHLRKFAPVTIRMAKDQNLFLNPAKISGICGRLLCCLSYEQDNYERFLKESPKPGKLYHTAKGLLKVLRVNMFKNNLACVNETNEELEFTLDEWKALKPWRSPQDEHGDEDSQEIDPAEWQE